MAAGTAAGAAGDDVTATRKPQKKAEVRRGIEERLAAAVENTLRSADALGPALESVAVPASAPLARAMQAQQNHQRAIEAEFGLLTSAEVGMLLGSRASNPRSAASDRYRAGTALALRRGNTLRFPGFQFAQGTVLPVIADLIAAARAHGWDEPDLIAWLCAPSGWLDDARPVDLLRSAPEHVLAAAEAKFTTQW